MDRTSGKAEYVIQESGCGPFQVLMILLIYVVVKVPTAFTMMFMSFGNYNPGWRCLDNSTSRVNSHLNDTGTMSLKDNLTRLSYSKDLSCEEYKRCQHVEFDPETSTIVTEWNLICDSGWIPSFIISIQMTGVLIGSFLSGVLGDTFGRKRSMYGALAVNAALSVISIFSPTWHVFMVLRFSMGITSACLLALYYVLPSEFLSIKWRGRMSAIPSWHLGGALFAITAMIFKDWKSIHIVLAVMSLVCCIPALWVPESLRWLEVKNKTKEFDRVARTIVTLNNKSHVLEQCKGFDLAGDDKPSQGSDAKKYSMRDVFRKGYRATSLIIAFLWMSMSVIYYAISFGVKAMSGDFYINLIILFAIEIPFAIIPIQIPNIVGRKVAIMIFVTFSSLCLLLAMGLELWTDFNVRTTGTLVLALMAKTSINGAWYTIMTLTSEIYPTVIRSNGMGYGNLMARVGGITAPFLIPQNPDTVWVCYAIMGCMGLICCMLVSRVPETKGKKLKEFFDED